VTCPHSGGACGGHQCCPGVPETGGRSFVCPSADPAWRAKGFCQLPEKLVDCLAPHGPGETTEEPGASTSTTAAPKRAKSNTTTTAERTTTSPATTAAPAAPTSTSLPLPPPITWCERPVFNYSLQWSAEGRNFFDEFDFLTSDANNGAALYLPRDEALRAGVATAAADHAVLRTGARAGTPTWPKRESAKIQSKHGWKYFLMMMKYTHVPWGCGVWPALWTHAVGVPWPNGGELDVLEYANDGAQQASFHTGEENSCKLDEQVTNACKPMPDTNGMGYDCDTAYPDKLGCAPNSLPLLPGEVWSREGGVIAVQWTPAFLKVFHIPSDEAFEDSEGDDPQPQDWDEWLVSYYPFALSEAKSPGSCPDPANVMAPQHIMLNINMCGDWAGKIWNTSGSCVNVQGPAYPSQCRAVDPLMEYDPQGDCCTQFIYDRNDTYGTSEYLHDRAYFNISWIKVFQADHDESVPDGRSGDLHV